MEAYGLKTYLRILVDLKNIERQNTDSLKELEYSLKIWVGQ